jgi:hypothetical protein
MHIDKVMYLPHTVGMTTEAFFHVNATSFIVEHADVCDIAVVVGDPETGAVTESFDFQFSCLIDAESYVRDILQFNAPEIIENRSIALSKVHSILSSMPSRCYGRADALHILKRSFAEAGLPHLDIGRVSCLLRDLRRRYTGRSRNVETTALQMRLPIRTKLKEPDGHKARTMAQFCFEATQFMLRNPDERDVHASPLTATKLLLRDLSAILQLHRQKTAAQTAVEPPDFNPLSFVGSKEIYFSSIIASLLDPDGSHGQGLRFIALFMKRFASDFYIPFLTSPDSHIGRGLRVSVVTEAITEAARFVDVLIEINDGHDSYIIGIENKIWAGDQHLQFAHYLEWIGRRATGFGEATLTKMIYLTPFGSPPSEYSIDKDEFFDHVIHCRAATASYNDIIEWLADCQAAAQSPRVTQFLKDLISHISKNILRKNLMPASNPLIDMIISEEKMLETYFEAHKISHDIKSTLLHRFRDEISLLAGDNTSCTLGCWRTGPYRVRLDIGDGMLAVFGTDYRDFGWVWYGLEAAEPRQDIETLKIRANEVLGVKSHGYLAPGGEPGCEGTRIWRHKCLRQGPMGVDETWLDSAEPWIALQNGTLARAFVKWAFEAKEKLKLVDALT